MHATTVLYGQVLVVLAITLSGVWGATQWTAAALGYQARLGAPWFELLGTPVYHPWRLFEWWFVFDAYAPDVFNVGGSTDERTVALLEGMINRNNAKLQRSMRTGGAWSAA